LGYHALRCLIILRLQPYIDHSGTLHVRSASSGYAARLRFKEPFLAFSDKQVHQVGLAAGSFEPLIALSILSLTHEHIGLP
jgi:hypothetical protein